MASSVTGEGQVVAEIVPPPAKFFDRHVFALNARLFVLVLCGVSMGLDSAMMNGLQTLDTWADYFNHPSSYLLGIINAVLNLAPVSPASPTIQFPSST
jgi:hypothetical protein